MGLELIDNDLGWEEVIGDLKALNGLEGFAGVIGDDDVLEYAPRVEAETGFMRDSIDAEMKRLSDTAEGAMGEVIDGDINGELALEITADDAADIIIEGIEERGLVSTGALRDSITSEVQNAVR